VHGRQTGQTYRVSAASDRAQATSLTYKSDILADGQFVAFQSSATNLVGVNDMEAFGPVVERLADTKMAVERQLGSRR